MAIFGKALRGETSAETAVAELLLLCRFKKETPGKVKKLFVFLEWGTNTAALAKFKGLIYSAGSTEPDELLSEGSQITYTQGSSTQGWIELPITEKELAAGEYYIGFLKGGAAHVSKWCFDPEEEEKFAKKIRATVGRTYTAGAPKKWSEVSVSSSYDEEEISIYAEYSGAAVSVTNPGTQFSHKSLPAELAIVGSNVTSWTATGLPTGLSINSGTGRITGEPITLGTYSVTVTGKAEPGNEQSVTFVWEVLNISSFAPVGAKPVTCRAVKNSKGEVMSVVVTAAARYETSDENEAWILRNVFKGVVTEGEAGSGGGEEEPPILTPFGSLLSWGYNQLGELGQGYNSGSGHAVPQGVANLNEVTQIALGGDFSLALRKDGTLWGWGYNQGRLGRGSFRPPEYTFTPLQSPKFTNQKIKAIHANSANGIVLLENGEAMAWGGDDGGHVGVGGACYVFTPAIVESAENVPLTKITAVCMGHRVCYYVKDDHTVWKSGVAYPARESTYAVHLTEFDGLGVKAISGTHEFILVLCTDGKVRTRGHNPHGQLGNGKESTSGEEAVYVPSIPEEVVQISVAEYHAMALTKGGRVYTWGWNARGQIGKGTFGGAQLTPFLVPGLTEVTAISAGGGEVFGTATVGTQFSMALRKDKTLWAWGGNNQGTLGDGTFFDKASPAQVAGGYNDIVAFVASEAKCVAIRESPTLVAPSITATPGTHSVTVKWTPPTGDRFTGWKVEWRRVENKPGTEVQEALHHEPSSTKLPATAREFTITGLPLAALWTPATNLLEVLVIPIYNSAKPTPTVTPETGEKATIKWTNDVGPTAQKEEAWLVKWRRIESSNYVQEIKTKGSPTGGTFKLSFRGQTTAALPYKATAAEIGTALNGLSTIAGTVTCTKGPLPAVVVVTFTTHPELGKFIEVTEPLLTGGTSPKVEVTGNKENWNEETVEESSEATSSYLATVEPWEGLTGENLEASVAGAYKPLWGQHRTVEVLPLGEGAEIPLNLAPPVLEGPKYPKVGSVLKIAKLGEWANGPITARTFVWRHYTEPEATKPVIAGATGESYTVKAEDVGFGIGVEETATNAQGTSPSHLLWASSEPTRFVK